MTMSPRLFISVLVSSALVILNSPLSAGRLTDWLVSRSHQPTKLLTMADGSLKLTNGIISRTFAIRPDFFTLDFYSMEKQASLLRALGPEAVIAIDGRVYRIGGVLSDLPRAYLNRTDLNSSIHRNPDAFHFARYNVRQPTSPYPYRPVRGAPDDIVWPPRGERLDVHFLAPESASPEHRKLDVTVHYEMYDGIPLLAKWLSFEAGGNLSVTVLSVEYLAVNFQWAKNGYNWFVVETDWAWGTQVNWETDPAQSEMPGSFEPCVNVTYSPLTVVEAAKGFTTFRTLELVVGSSDPERVSLARSRMLRLLAPQTWENPLYFHITSSNSSDVRHIVDQMHAVGFEMLMYSFGSGFDIESDNLTYIAEIARDVAYATKRGIEVGGYDLIAMTRRVPQPMQAIGSGGHNACFASGWYDYLLERVLSFMAQTNMTAFAADGPYHGYRCSATNHPHHRDRHDSVFMQTKLQGDFFTELRRREVFINQPDFYFYQGGNRKNMGYDEYQFSLARWQDISISRQGFYDDTYHIPPSAGWMFLPIAEYHSGGDNASFAPLSRHARAYDWALAQYMTAGVGVVYRGLELYDSHDIRELLRGWVDFYKRYRDILRSDLVHVRRADMQGVDCYMHVNPFIHRRALIMVLNPTTERVTQTLTVPLYYTGLARTANVTVQGDWRTARLFRLARDYSVGLSVDLKPVSYVWYLVTE